jgi:hypothetical protein
MFWTPEQDAELKRLWPEVSAREIAKRLGTTRNAVIGRIHRIDRSYADYISAKKQEARDHTERRRDAVKAAERKIINAMNNLLARGLSRNEAIAQARQAGARLEVIGNAIGVTRQRVDQIVARQKESVGKRRESA